MSMSDALRRLNAPWLEARKDEPILAPETTTVLQEMQELVRMAAVTETLVDRQSATWIAVCRWAATELLETFAKQEGADAERAAALRARAKTLRDLLAMNDRQNVVKFADTSPYI